MNRKWIALVVLTLGVNSACAASFDCDKAGTKVEKMICADLELSKLDEELGDAYAKARDVSSAPDELTRQQRDWIKKRNECGDPQCLSEKYNARITELEESVVSSNIPATNAERRYPPYPDVWGYELRPEGDASRRSIVGVYQRKTGELDVVYVNSRVMKKREDGSCCDFKKKYSELSFFSGESRSMSVDELNRFSREHKDVEVTSSKDGAVIFATGGSLEIKFDNKGSARCGANFEYSLVRKDASGNGVAEKSLLYLRDEPIDSPFNPYCEGAEGMGKHFLQQVESSRLMLIPLRDETYIVYEVDGDLIVRLDKDFNTKFVNRHLFLVDVAKIAEIQKKLLDEDRFNYQTLDDAVANYLKNIDEGEN